MRLPEPGCGVLPQGRPARRSLAVALARERESLRLEGVNTAGPSGGRQSRCPLPVVVMVHPRDRASRAWPRNCRGTAAMLVTGCPGGWPGNPDQ